MNPVIFLGSPFVAQRKAHPVLSVELPKLQPFGAPVLITDVATPLAGETVLSLLMKRMMAAELGSDQDP